jgi:hypothetical protein
MNRPGQVVAYVVAMIVAWVAALGLLAMAVAVIHWAWLLSS